MNRWTKHGLMMTLLLMAAAQASAACIRVEKSATVSIKAPEQAKSLAVWLAEGAGSWRADLKVKPISGEFPGLGQDDVDIVKTQAAQAGAQRKALRLAYVAEGRKLITVPEPLEFVLADEPKAQLEECDAKKVTSAGDDKTNPPPVASADSALCAQLLDKPALWSNPKPLAPHEHWIVFDSKGRVCVQPYPLRQGDRMRFGLALRAGEAMPAQRSVDHAGCTTPTGGVTIIGTIPAALQAQAGEAKVVDRKPGLSQDALVQVGVPLECASNEVTLTAKLDDLQGPSVKVVLFSRTTAVLHVGVLNSKLREPEFGLRTTGATTVITDKEGTGRGPEYVAMVVLQGFPHYFQRGFSYQGRDLVHDNDPKDRTGLAFAFGLKDPGKRFGVGLTYEVVKGVNIVGMHEWLRRSRLDGVSVGDTFAGAAGDIPKSKEWAKAWSFGISFDSTYLTSIFRK